jgi:hypothetical protein
MRCRINPDNRTELWFTLDERIPSKSNKDFWASFDYDEDKENMELHVAFAVATINNLLEERHKP